MTGRTRIVPAPMVWSHASVPRSGARYGDMLLIHLRLLDTAEGDQLSLLLYQVCCHRIGLLTPRGIARIFLVRGLLPNIFMASFDLCSSVATGSRTVTIGLCLNEPDEFQPHKDADARRRSAKHLVRPNPLGYVPSV